MEDILQYNIYVQYDSIKYLKYKKRRNSVSDFQGYMEGAAREGQRTDTTPLRHGSV